MKTISKRALTLLLTLLMLLGCIGPALAAEEGTVTEPFAYTGEDVAFIKENGDGFGMFTAQKGTTCVINGSNVVIHFVPKNTTVYGGLHFGAISDELTQDVTFNEDGTFDITLPKENCGKALPVAPIKKSDGGTTSSQYYLAIPAADKLEDVTPVEPFDYAGEDVAVIKENGSGFGMFTAQEGTTCVINGSNVVIHFVPKNTTVYGWLHFGAISDELTQDVTFNEDGTFDITLPKENCGKALPVAPIKKSDGGTTSTQYYLAIPAADKLEDVTPVEPAPEVVELTVTNNTGMFKVVTARLETLDGKTELVFALSGSGYHDLFKGTYEEAVANDANTDAWCHGALNADGKWEFRLPVAEDESYIPLVAISNSYYEKYLNGQNALARAFYPRQMELDREAKALVTGDYEFTQELTVTNNVKMFKVSSAALDTVGGPNSNNYKAALVLTMGSESYDKAFLGRAAEVDEDAALALSEEKVFEFSVKWVETFGQPDTLRNLLDEPFIVSFRSAKNGTWYERQFTVSETDNTLVIDPVLADYSAVDAALEKVPEDLSIYTDETAQAVTDAVNAVDRTLTSDKQADVDAMAQAIETAVAALELKPTEPAPEVVELTVTNNVKMFKVSSASLMDGADLHLTMGSESYDKAFVGRAADASEDAAVSLEEGNLFILSVKDLLAEPFIVSFRSAKNGTWYERQFTLNAEEKTLVIDPVPADYSAVDAALEKVPEDLSIYTDETAQAVTDAVNAVDRTLTSDKQADVDAMAQAIETAVAALALKPADYTAVDAALAKVPEDLSGYTDETAQAVTEAVNAVVRDLTIDKQAEVDAMAQAIEDAVAALEQKPSGGGGGGGSSTTTEIIELTVENTTGMFKVAEAYLERKGSREALIFTLTGQSYHYLYKGTYAEALSNGDRRSNWIAGAQNDDGKWEFSVALDENDTLIPLVSISQTYLDKYDAGENPLERSFYPRQVVLNRRAKTLTVGDYDETTVFTVKSLDADFKVENKADMRVVGGPNSNNYRFAPTLKMKDDTFDQVTYPTVVNGAVGTETIELGSDKTFAISMLNAPTLFAFRDQEPIEMSFRVKATGETAVYYVTIDQLAKTITVSKDADGGSGSSGGGAGGKSDGKKDDEDEKKDEEKEEGSETEEESETGSALPFTDVKAGAWYVPAVQYVFDKKLMNGVTETTFEPDSLMNRAMLATVLYRLEGEPETEITSVFADVAADAWYAKAVSWAYAKEIFLGVSSGENASFAPLAPLTREQLVTVLYRYARFKGMDVSVGEDTNILSYDDAFDVSDWAMSAMQWACGSGLIQGRTASTLNPRDNTTRAEIATILQRFDGLKKAE